MSEEYWKADSAAAWDRCEERRKETIALTARIRELEADLPVRFRTLGVEAKTTPPPPLTLQEKAQLRERCDGHRGAGELWISVRPSQLLALLNEMAALRTTLDELNEQLKETSCSVTLQPSAD